jgi:hypothetical protein
MIKKLGLAVALSLLAAPAFAACTNPLVIKDGSAANISMSMTSNADGFCQYNFNMAQINGVVPLMGNGATGTGSPRVTIANDNTIPTGWPTATNQTAAAAAKGEGATGAAVPSGAQYMGLNSGGNLLGWAAKAGNTYAATDVVPGVAVVNTQVSVTPGDGITTTVYGTAPASPVIGSDLLFNGTSYDRQRSGGVTGMAGVNLQATPSGGATTFKLIGAASNNSTLIGSAGVHTVYSYQTSSISASTPYWLKFYDKATAPTCGTDTPVKVILIPPTNSGNNGNIPVGFSVALGLGICVVGGIADNDNTSIAAATVAVNVDYK